MAKIIFALKHFGQPNDIQHPYQHTHPLREHNQNKSKSTDVHKGFGRTENQNPKES